LVDNKMVIVAGIPQSGKSTLIEQLISEDEREHVRIYVTEQIDTKSLIGNYVCAEKVGEFEWREGPISSVIAKGGILVLENFQDAKDDLIELILEAISDQFFVRGERRRIKNSFRVVCAYTTGTEQSEEKLRDLKKASNDVQIFIKIPLTFSDLMSKHHCLISNSLINSILKDVHELTVAFNHDPKSELKCTVIDTCKFIERVAWIYSKKFGSDNPIHFSEDFRLCILHQFYDIYLSKFRQEVPANLLERLGEAFKLQASQISAYLDAYNAGLTTKISDFSISTKRYGDFAREMGEPEYTGSSKSHQKKKTSVEFFATSLVANLVEAILGSCKFRCNMLLVGEAGCGKTTIVQETAGLLGKTLHVYNMSQSSDVSDLIGGFKPLNAKTYISETADEFCSLLRSHFDYDKNIKLVSYLRQLIAADKNVLALAYMIRELSTICSGCTKKCESQGVSEKEKKDFRKKHKIFEKFLRRLDTIMKLRDRLESSLIFKFIQGNLIKALKEGQWILLDEINLASPEVLQNILPILEDKSVILIEKGELKEVFRHPDFKLFGCMNPGNTVGKKELPQLIRKNFIEYFVHELENPDEITEIVKNRSRNQFQEVEYQRITSVFLKVKELANNHLITDGFNRKPTVSLRALSRAITISMISWQFYPNQRSRAVVEGLYAGFSSNLSTESKKTFEDVICKTFQIDQEFLNKAETSSQNIEKQGYINIEGFLLKKGGVQPKADSDTDFLMTGSIKRNLKDLMRVLAHSSFPILLEGPTSAGKTSMIKYLGERSGNKVVRINNHQHTDLDEYIGTYSPDETGRLVFKEGLMVEAMRKGYWLILDELNLAKSEILEALNRLLDDNRELYVPEINEVIIPHPDFRIFATQNPLDYGGRKELSIAFRSRFFHFFIREIEENDLVEIIERRCKVPMSRSKMLVSIMNELRVLRSRQNIFAGKESLITIRDLIKWASRDIINQEELALNGFCLLAERLRYESERLQVKEVLAKKCLKKDQFLDPSGCYDAYFKQSISRLEIPDEHLNSVFWSQSFIRMYSLVMMALEKSEPVLLVGETGSGKTTIADLISKIFNVELYTVNCHQFTESSDFLGGLRPVRGKEGLLDQVNVTIKEMIDTMDLPEALSKDLMGLHENVESDKRMIHWEICAQATKSWMPEECMRETRERVLVLLDDLKNDLERLGQMFEWVDGPLIQAMSKGGVLLIDEISLAQDSVLERLNSVLEKEKTIVISEKGDGSVQEIVAHPKFMIIATMNPSGDYGKKELTPALRNRFTEIWVEPVTSPAILEEHKDQIYAMKEEKDLESLYSISNDFVNFVLKEITKLVNDGHLKECKNHQINDRNSIAKLCLFSYQLTTMFNRVYGPVLKPLTIRDIKSTLPFIIRNIQSFDELNKSLLQDYAVVLLGGFKCIDKAVASAALEDAGLIAEQISCHFLSSQMAEETHEVCSESETEFSIGRYSATKEIIGHTFNDPRYSVDEEIVRSNLKTILMALTLDKAIMLEGPPGVGKTSLIQFLAKKIGIKFYRVNLNEQTDMIDLLGSDVPSSKNSVFSWADGVLIQAMKEGAWLLLDELNMATQTVLEGLNSILDHRGSIYIPELDQTIHKHPRFRIFASQNPMSMGSGRKGLPHSFITRFTRAWIEELSRESLRNIINKVYRRQLEDIPHLNTLVNYFFEVKEIMQNSNHVQSRESQWEFNLRDLHKMIQFIELDLAKHECDDAECSHSTLEIIQKACCLTIMARIDSPELKIQLRGLFRQVFGGIPYSFSRSLMNSSQCALPKHLITSNKGHVRNIVEEPLRHCVQTVVDAAHPILFLHQSRSESSVINLENLVTSLASKIYSRTVKKVTLFGSSDIIDLIGSYEQVNPTSVSQKNAEHNLITKAESGSLEGSEWRKAIQSCFESSNHTDTLFSWKESELCKAIRQGDWVILKGAELVNPAILERLNGLLEEDEIFINEAIGTGIETEILHKSKQFRIFVLYDLSKAKQLPSRALRNRCIEINLDNFEVDLQDKNAAEDEDKLKFIKQREAKLVETAIKAILHPLDATDQDFLYCEDYSKVSRITSSINIFFEQYWKIFNSLHQIKATQFDSSRSIETYNDLCKMINKSVVNRANFSFGRKPSIQDNLLQLLNSKDEYKDFITNGENVFPLIVNFVTRFSKQLGKEGFGNHQDRKLLWDKIIQQISNEGAEELEEIVTNIGESGDDSLRLLASLWMMACGKNRKITKWLKPLEEMVNKDKRIRLRESHALSEEERHILVESKGFVSPYNLCLNVLFLFLLTKSKGLGAVVEKSLSRNKKEGKIWKLICKLTDSREVLKFQLVSQAHSNFDLMAQISPIVSASLMKSQTVDGTALAELLDLIFDTINKSFTDVLDKITCQFIDYDLVDETTNLSSNTFVFKPDPKSIDQVLSFLSHGALLEQLPLSEKVLTIASHCLEYFEPLIYLNQTVCSLEDQTRHIINLQKSMVNAESLSAETSLSLPRYLDTLSQYYKIDKPVVLGIKTLLREGQRRELIRLAGKIDQLNHSEYRLSDWDCIERLDSRLRNLCADKDNSGLLDHGIQEDIFLDPGDAGSLACAGKVKLLEHICLYAENPNHNTVSSMLASLSQLLNCEDQIMTSSNSAFASGNFDSIFNHEQDLRKIHETLSKISRELKSQKTRQLSRYQFDDSPQNSSSEHSSLSYFVAQILFRVLSKNTAFLADSDIQAMKAIKDACRRVANNWEEVQFEEIQSVLFDSYLLLQSFIQSGQIITFGDFLIPFFGCSTQILLTGRHLVVQKEQLNRTGADEVSFPTLDDMKCFRQKFKEETNLPMSVCQYLSLTKQIATLQGKAELQLVAATETLARETAIGRGRSIDEANRLKNLAKGIERVVKDEYTKEVVEQNKAEEKFEIKRIFGVESDLLEDPKYKEAVKYDAVRAERLSFLKYILDGVFMLPKDGSKIQQKNKDLLERSIFGIFARVEDSRLDIRNVDETAICEYYSSILRKDISKKTTTSGQRDIRKSLMLDPLSIETVDQFETFWINQMHQFVELEENSFYKGRCIEDLKKLRSTIFLLLDKVQELRADDDLRNLPAFNNIVSVADYLLSLPLHKATLNEVCLLLEKLSTYVLDYKTLTPRKYHFPEIEEKIRDALYEYRQIERKSWRGLIFAQGLDQILADIDDCIKIKNVVMDELTTIDDNEVVRNARERKLLDLVDTFLSKTSLLKQLFRLFWISRILRCLPSSPTLPGFKSLASHLLRYHLTFLPTSLHLYNTNFTSVSDPIKENEKLSNWHMKDMVNMKSNVTKFHKGVHRAMKAHKDVLEISVEGTIYKFRRDAYLAKDSGQVKTAVSDADDAKLGDKKPEKVVSKALIDKIKNKPEYSGDLTSRLMTANLKLCRLIKVQEWLPMVGEKGSTYIYKNYESARDQCDQFISDWIQTLDGLKDSQSRSNRLRVLDGYLKLLYSMGIREKQRIEHWDPLKSFAYCPNPIDADKLDEPHHKKIISKIMARSYEMVDILYVNKANMGYHADIQPSIRLKMQGYMMNMAAANMDMFKKLSKSLRLISDIKRKISRPDSGVMLLTLKDQAKFESDYNRFDAAVSRIASGGFCSTSKMRQDMKTFDIMKDFAAGNCSVAELNEKLQSNGYPRSYKERGPSHMARSDAEFVKSFLKFQNQLSKEVASYDLLTKSKLFVTTIPAFMAGLPTRLATLQSLSRGHSDLKVQSQCELLLKVLVEHLVQAAASFTRWNWMGCRVLHSLIYSGLCVTKEDDQEQQEGSEEYDIGTGVGEGKGDENKTDKYEFEEQVLGEKGGDDEEGDMADDDGSAHESQAESQDEAGGESMELEHEDKGMEDDGKKDEDREEKEDDDQAMSQVDDGDIDQDLWDKENEDMNEESQESESIREDEEREYKDQQGNLDNKEQRAKEPTEKEQREAQDFEEQEEPEQKDSEKDENEDNDKEGDEQNYAEVESRSAMSSRNENDQMEFDQEQQEPEVENDKEDDIDINDEMNEEELKEESINEEGKDEEFEDALEKAERKIKEEEEENNAGEKDENREDVKDSGLNPKMADEVENIKNEQNDNQITEKENKSKMDSNKTQKLNEKEKDQHEKEAKEIDEVESQAKKQEEDSLNQDLSKETKPIPETLDSIPQKKLDISTDKLASMLERMLKADDVSEDQDDGDVEGLAEGEGAEVRIKQNLGEKQRQGMKHQEQENTVQIHNELNKISQAEEKDLEREEKMNLEEIEDNENIQGKLGNEDESEIDESEAGNPQKKIKAEDHQEEIIEKHLITMDDVKQYMQLLNDDQHHLSSSNHSWASIEQTLRTKAYNLCEELRNIFKPTKISGLKGDFRTGKRLNMRKVISYVASNYRKDKIWLRRSDPSQRDYEIALAIDDTLSMSEKNVGYFALESLIILALALSKLEVGKINISGIRSGMHEVLPFNKPFTQSDGQRIVDNFSFNYSDQHSADMGLPAFLAEIAEKFTPGHSGRILIVINDGRCNKTLVNPVLRQLEEDGILVVNIILDRKHEKSSVLNIRSTTFETVGGSKKVKISQYMDDYPFGRYVIVQDTSELTSVLVSIMRECIDRD
jgi:midasin (ATPase involved in ribosome maturation)